MAGMQAFDPLVREWFEHKFTRVTEPQELGWPAIQQGRDVLISAPTGSGKTLAAFLWAIDQLVRAARAGSLKPFTHSVYVSPLKALSNDVALNLNTPLNEIGALAAERGVTLAPIRVAVRTGDTNLWDRRKMAQEPPHILVTTPESLYLLLTSESGRKGLQQVSTVIVDEIHALAGNKRGSHVALTLERFGHLTGGFQRIGLSATVRPIEEVAQFLSASAEIVQVGHRRRMDLGIGIPNDELGPVATNEMWADIYDRVARMIREHRTTLVFVNTRRLAERVTQGLAERLGGERVMTHHGSVAKEIRFETERRLKQGELQAVVATASLELGIDIGSVDLVVQIGSPRVISVALQRFGRAGHWVGAIPKGRLIASTRDELIESIGLLEAIEQGELDGLEIPEAPLDILAQQITAEVACGEWSEHDLLAMCRRAYPYRKLTVEDFASVMEILGEGIATSRGRSGAYLHRDLVNGRVRARRGARLAALTSGGAIPENANYAVVAEPDGVTVGTLDEDFAVESMAGDVFLLGTTSWRIRRVGANKVYVEDAHGAAPTIPFWRGEAPGRTIELSAFVARVRDEIAQGRESWPFLPTEAAAQAVAYVRGGAAMLGAVPTQRTIVAERFFDESGGMQLVIHAPFGSRITRAWGLALRKRFCRSFNFELQAAATDNGLVLSLTEQHAFPLEIVFDFLKPETLEHVLTQALVAAPMFGARWRWNTNRALAVLRFGRGSKVPPNIQRMRAEDLMAAVFPDQVACAENLSGEIRIPDHPLVKETIRNCLHEGMDLNGLLRILKGIRAGEIRTVAADTPEPSLFSHEILNANPYAFLDDAPLEERRTRAVQMRSTMRGGELEEGAGALDAAAIAEVTADAWPLMRNADELHDALLTLIAMPSVQDHFLFLVADRRATELSWGGTRFMVAAERLAMARKIYPGADEEPGIAAFGAFEGTREEAIYVTIRGWMESMGPVTVQGLSERLALPGAEIEAALAQLEAEGQVMRGRFRSGVAEQEWCQRRLLARIHRLTLGRLRKEIEPASSGEFLKFLCRWMHVVPGSLLHGADGLLHIVRQLQGYEVPAGLWESQILPRRVAGYKPELLDELCLSGEVMWGRISPHPAFERESPKRVRPTSVAPVTLFLREDAEWLFQKKSKPELSPAASDVLADIEQHGASFFGELSRRTHRLASEVEDGLWELVAAGLVTADGFENLRSLIDPKRRRGEGKGRTVRPRHAAGRWALLDFAAPANAAEPWARQLLRRWGVVFRDLMAREGLPVAWREILMALRRMEARGEVRGGRFVTGLVGEQFALPEALDLLRTVRRMGETGVEITLSPADPLNLAGVIMPGARVSALAGELVQVVG